MRSKLTEIRKSAGFKIEDAAEKLGLPFGYLSNIENGERGVSPERAAHIAKLYGKDIDEIFLPSRYSVREV